jgi:hypothetical protein
MKWLSLQCRQDFGFDKIDRLVTRPRIKNVFSHLPDELTHASDTSNTVCMIKLCLKPPLNVIRVRVFLKEKPNDHSLLALHPAVKNLNTQRDEHFKRRDFLEARVRMPSSGIRKVHSIGCLEMHEVLFGS